MIVKNKCCIIECDAMFAKIYRLFIGIPFEFHIIDCSYICKYKLYFSWQIHFLLVRRLNRLIAYQKPFAFFQSRDLI